MRQYIGARYVVKIYENSLDPSSAEWEANVNYEPLTMVTLNNGTYLSKKEVPASIGSPAANPSYWVQTGFYNGQILNLQNQIDAINATIVNIEKEFIPKADSALSNHHILVLGDSYEVGTGYATDMCNYLGHGTLSTVSTNFRKSDDSYFFVARKGGAGFTNNGGGKSSGNGFLELLTEAANGMSDDEKASISDIAIVGGANDSFFSISEAGWNSIEPAAQDCADFIDANFPNASVKVFFMARARGVNTPGITYDNIKRMLCKYQNICGFYKWGFVTNAEYVLFSFDGIIGPDNLHPIASYGDTIAQSIIEGLNCGSVDVSWVPDQIYTFTADGVNYTSANRSLSRYVTNGMTKIVIEKLDGAFTGVTLTLNNYVKIGTQNAFYMNEPRKLAITTILDSGSGYIFANGSLKFDGYDVYFAYRGSEATQLNPITVTNATFTDPIEFFVDTMDI